MKNEELKKPIPVELEDEALDTVSGGTEPSQDEEIIGGMPIGPCDEVMKLHIYNEAEKRSN